MNSLCGTVYLHCALGGVYGHEKIIDHQGVVFVIHSQQFYLHWPGVMVEENTRLNKAAALSSAGGAVASLAA